MNLPRPPGPRDRLLGFALLREMEHRYFDFWQETHRAYGDAVYMRLVNRDLYAFAHPELIREVLVDKAKSFIRYERHMEVFAQLHGQSVLVTEGEIWRKQRRTLQPGFNPKRFGAYAQQVAEAARDSLDRLAVETPLDFEHAMNMLTIDVVLRTMFGSRAEQDTAGIEAAVRLLSRIGYAEMYRPMTLPDWLPLPGKAGKRRALRLLDELITSHIRRRRMEREERDDLLGMLLTAAASPTGRYATRA